MALKRYISYFFLVLMVSVLGFAKSFAAVVVISGHGSKVANHDTQAFSFKRAADHKGTVYYLTFDGISVADRYASEAEQNILNTGVIPKPTQWAWAKTVDSRIGGALTLDYIAYPPTGLHIYTPGTFHTTDNVAIGSGVVTLHHNGVNVAASTEIQVIVKSGKVKLSEIVGHFNDRAYDFVWSACKSPA